MNATKEMIDVMQAFADGKKIEYSIIGGVVSSVNPNMGMDKVRLPNQAARTA